MTTSYEELELAWRREFRSVELQPLRHGFFKDLSSYRKRLREAEQNLDAESLKAVLLEDESLRSEQLLSQLLDRRLRKLWSQSRPVQSPDFDSVEKEAYQTISSLKRDYQKMRGDVSQGGEPTTQRSKTAGSAIVRFEKGIPSIIGVDLKTHGPFEKEDLARLPRENAEGLIRQGVAIEIIASSQDNE